MEDISRIPDQSGFDMSEFQDIKVFKLGDLIEDYFSKYFSNFDDSFSKRDTELVEIMQNLNFLTSEIDSIKTNNKNLFIVEETKDNTSLNQQSKNNSKLKEKEKRNSNENSLNNSTKIKENSNAGDVSNDTKINENTEKNKKDTIVISFKKDNVICRSPQRVTKKESILNKISASPKPVHSKHLKEIYNDKSNKKNEPTKPKIVTKSINSNYKTTDKSNPLKKENDLRISTKPNVSTNTRLNNDPKVKNIDKNGTKIIETRNVRSPVNSRSPIRGNNKGKFDESKDDISELATKEMKKTHLISTPKKEKIAINKKENCQKLKILKLFEDEALTRAQKLIFRFSSEKAKFIFKNFSRQMRKFYFENEIVELMLKIRLKKSEENPFRNFSIPHELIYECKKQSLVLSEYMNDYKINESLTFSNITSLIYVVIFEESENQKHLKEKIEEIEKYFYEIDFDKNIYSKITFLLNKLKKSCDCFNYLRIIYESNEDDFIFNANLPHEFDTLVKICGLIGKVISNGINPDTILDIEILTNKLEIMKSYAECYL